MTVTCFIQGAESRSLRRECACRGSCLAATAKDTRVAHEDLVESASQPPPHGHDGHAGPQWGLGTPPRSDLRPAARGPVAVPQRAAGSSACSPSRSHSRPCPITWLLARFGACRPLATGERAALAHGPGSRAPPRWLHSPRLWEGSPGCDVVAILWSIENKPYLRLTPGLIIDAFGELRDQQEQVKEDMEVSVSVSEVASWLTHALS